MIVRAAAHALTKVPDVNGSYEEDGCRYYADADICIAVALDGGLATFVIPAAQKSWFSGHPTNQQRACTPSP